MKRPALVPRVVSWVTCVIVATALLSVSLPHHHDIGASNPSESCRLQKVHQGFSSAPGAPHLIQDTRRLVAHDSLPPHDAPRTLLVVRLSVPRAPPVLS